MGLIMWGEVKVIMNGVDITSQITKITYGATGIFSKNIFKSYNKRNRSINRRSKLFKTPLG